MPLPRPAQNIALASSCAGLLVASLIGIAVVSDDTSVATGTGGQGDRNGELTGTTTGGDSGGASTTAAAGADVGGTKGPGPGGGDKATTSTAPGPTTPPPPEAIPKRLGPPKAGTYTYDGTLNGRATKAVTNKVETTSTAGGTTKQKITQTENEGGQEITLISDVTWNNTGATVSQTLIQLAGGTATCDWNPDFLVYAGDLKVGKEWTFDTSCKGVVQGGQANGQQFRARRKVTQKVIGAKQETVAGTTVPTWTIQFEERFEFDVATITTVTNAKGVEQFAAEVGLPVAREREAETTSSLNPKPTTNKQTRRLQNLTPQ